MWKNYDNIFEKIYMMKFLEKFQANCVYEYFEDQRFRNYQINVEKF